MSKGAKHTLLGFPQPPSDGHRDIKTDGDDIRYPMVYCPKIKDIVSAGYTSAGMQCRHCKKIY